MGVAFEDSRLLDRHLLFVPMLASAADIAIKCRTSHRLAGSSRIALIYHNVGTIKDKRRLSGQFACTVPERKAQPRSKAVTKSHC
jgi:hypothetical protein